MSRRTLPSLVVLSLACATFGCDRATFLSSFPQAAPYVGGRPLPSPFSLKTGSIRGFVFGEQGKGQPIPLAFVTTGSISSFAGNPTEPALTAEQEEDDEEPQLSVFHDFGDGKGAVLSERRVRKKPAGPISGEDGDFRNKYVYLRPGEFFLEDVPEGVATLIASYGNVTSQQNPVTVYGGFTLADVTMNLRIPVPVRSEDGSTLRLVEWTNVKPANGITVSVQVQEQTSDNGAARRDIMITYKPDPPDVAFELKAPPGSGGTTIRAVDLVYSWSTLRNPAPQILGPIRIPIAPTIVSAAQETAFGPPTVLTIPVGSSSLNAIFGGADPAAPIDPLDVPGMVVANIEFIDDAGLVVQDKSLKQLQVSTVLRKL